MPISTSQAQSAVKTLNVETFSLTPTALVALFEIDISPVLNEANLLEDTETYFRFHNNVKLINTSIFFQNKEYFPIPIRAEGFEINSRGTLPTPKLSISTVEDGSPVLALFKDKIRKFGDCVGAKVTRIRTFAKNLDTKNFYNSEVPEGFSPSPNSYFKDIFYIDRKSAENKLILEFELASILDVENIQLPQRLVLANRCTAQYRGEGCLYEFASRKTSIHGNGSLPLEAPPCATDIDEKISLILPGINLIDRGEYKSNETYQKGNFVFVSKNNLNYYFVARVDGIQGISPPNLNYWLADACSKSVKGCSLRFGLNGSVVTTNSNIVKGNLMFNGFPGANKVSSG